VPQARTGPLSERFTVYSYDRRGRGDSGDTAPYSIEREIEDLAAVIDAAGGPALPGDERHQGSGIPRDTGCPGETSRHRSDLRAVIRWR
jgi:hypothetical protein